MFPRSAVDVNNFNFPVLLLLLLTPYASSTSGLNFLSLAAIMSIIKHAVFSYITTNNPGSF